MKERPILFTGAMVRVLLAGDKTQTRRIVNPQPDYDPGCEPPYVQKPCRYGYAGDKLYVRETWQHSNWPNGPFDETCSVFYRADYMNDPHGPDGELSPEGKYRIWRPSIHMPRAASRILLEVTNVRVERLQNISEVDAKAEGTYTDDQRPEEHDYKSGYWMCHKCLGTGLHNGLGAGGGVIFDIDCRECDTYVKRYRHLWESINGAGSWAANPWVWVVEFRRVES